MKKLRSLVLAIKIINVSYNPIKKYIKLCKKYDVDLHHIRSTMVIAYQFLSKNRSLYNLVTTPYLRAVLSNIQYFINCYKGKDNYVDVVSSFMSVFKDFQDKLGV